MSQVRAFAGRVLGLVRRREQELAAEIQDHLSRLADDYRRQGMPAEDAERAARRDFGGAAALRDAMRDQRGLPMFDVLMQDGRAALRSLRHAPTFTVTAVLTLALGIGSTTAIFSVADAVLFRPLPYADVERLFVLGATRIGFSHTITGEVFHYVRARVRALEQVAAFRDGSGWNLVVGDRAEFVRGTGVTTRYFATIGVPLHLGREFTDAEDRPGGPAAVIISHAIWKRMFDGRPDTVGSVVTLGGEPHTVAGITAEHFQPAPPADVWTPLRAVEDQGINTTVIGRLGPETALEQANAELETLKPSMVRELRGTGRSFPRRVEQLAWVPFQQVVAGSSRFTLLLLLGAVGFVLLVACANVAGLQLVRAVARRREMATRRALGGGTTRALTQVMTEALLLGILGGLAGLLVARVGLDLFLPLVPQDLLLSRPIALDSRAVAVTLFLAFLTSLSFGIWPVFDVLRVDLRTALAQGAWGATAARHVHWMRRTLVVVETTLASVLLVGAGLFARTLAEASRVELGFQPEGVLTAQMSMQGARAGGPGLANVYDRLLDRIRELPGVEAAAVGSNIPVERSVNLPIEGTGSIGEPRSRDWRYVTPEYFDVFRIPTRAGRTFTAEDTAVSPRVAIVNEAFAREYFGDGRALGQSVQFSAQFASQLANGPHEIVGIVGDTKSASGTGWTRGHVLASPPPPTVFFPAMQVPDLLFSMVHQFVPVTWAVRVSGDEAALVPAIQEVVRGVAPTLPFIRFTPMSGVIQESIARQRLLLQLLGTFGAITLVLTAVGLYGLVSYSVAQRTREIGLHVALGATVGRVVYRFVREGVALAVIGAGVGLLAAAALSQLLGSLVFGVARLDPLTYTGVASLLILVATGASLIPAGRAAQVNATEALRSE